MRPEFVTPKDISALLTERYADILAEPTEVTVNPEMWKFSPVGHRLYVALDPTPEVYKGIVTANSYEEQMGIGVVLAVGEQVGMGPIQYPDGPRLENPSDLLYHSVVFGAHAGKPLRLDFIRDSHYRAAILVITSRDIWAVNWDFTLNV